MPRAEVGKLQGLEVRHFFGVILKPLRQNSSRRMVFVEATDARQILEQGQSVGLPDASAYSGFKLRAILRGDRLYSRNIPA